MYCLQGTVTALFFFFFLRELIRSPGSFSCQQRAEPKRQIELEYSLEISDREILEEAKQINNYHRWRIPFNSVPRRS